jgi:hypothetical protein
VCVHVGHGDTAPAGTVPAAPVSSWRFDTSWLLTREREYPNDAPTWEEMTPRFLGLAFVLGLLGPNLFSTLADRCLFTWPASLCTAFHATVLVCGWAETQQTSRRRARWLARLAVVSLLLVCWGYFELCRAVGMFIAWGFLFGLPFAFPLTYLAVRAQLKGHRTIFVALWTLLAFTAFYWSCQGLLLWKAASGGEG